MSAYGHINNPWECGDFTFSDFEIIIKKLLNGEVDAEEKIDGINLLISYKDGNFIAARSINHLKNNGEKALSHQALVEKFKGRELSPIFDDVMTDITSAFSIFQSDTLYGMFCEGRKWLSIEIVSVDYGGSVIKYVGNQIVFHGFLDCDENGKFPDGIQKSLPKILCRSLQARNADEQKTFTIKPLNKVSLSGLQEFRQKYYLDKFHRIVASYGVFDFNYLKDVRKRYFFTLLRTIGVDVNIYNKSELMKRWVYGDKSKRLSEIFKSLEICHGCNRAEIESSIKEIDKNIKLHYNHIIEPFESFFLQLGAEIIYNTPVETKNDPYQFRSKFGYYKRFLLSSEKDGDKEFVETQYKRLLSAGGEDMISPSFEGFTFFYGDTHLKLTGCYGPVNQIINRGYNI